MLHSLTLFVHSWSRWLLLAVALALGVRAVLALRAARPWSRLDERLASALVGLAGLQMLVGLLLVLWTSPIARAAWQAGLGAMLDHPTLLVFGLVHPLGMVLATGVVHTGIAKLRRVPDHRTKHRLAARTVAIWLAVVAALIPWPGLPWGRPAIRGVPDATASTVEPPAIYLARCAACHGDAGHGDGPAAASLNPRPRSFADPAWQRATTDERIRAAITRGGPAIGKSVVMPAHPGLPAAELDALVAFIRASAMEQP